MSITVGAFYYPWHKQHFGGGSGSGSKAEDEHGYLRRELQPRQEVRLGEYDDTHRSVIQQHIKWSRRANIKVWVTSWWGINSPEDVTIRNVILPTLKEEAEGSDEGEIKIAIFYESMYWYNHAKSVTTQQQQTDSDRGGIVDPFQRIHDDLSYLCTNYVDHPNYYRIDGNRPVIFVYLTRKLHHKLCALDTILERMRSACSPQYSLYIAGDHVWGDDPNDDDDDATPVKDLDAIFNYDMYGNMNQPRYVGREGVQQYYRGAQNWKAFAAANYDTAFIPGVTPGYNDRGVRLKANHPPMSRKLTEESPEGSLFEALLEEAVQLVDAKANNLLLVNSFNEWHEDTQIEPLDGKTSMEPYSLTQGLEYVGYGTLYLDILSRYTTTTSSSDNVLLPLLPMPLPLVPVSKTTTISSSADSIRRPIQFTGKPYSTGNPAALYFWPNNYNHGLRYRLNQRPPNINFPTLLEDLELSWRANIRIWILPWYHPNNGSTDRNAADVFREVLGTIQKLILYYSVNFRGSDMDGIADDVQHLCDGYLTKKNYFQSASGRPVLMLAGTRDLPAEVDLASVVLTIREVALANRVDLFLLGDQIFGKGPLDGSETYEAFKVLDGVMNMDVHEDMMMMMAASDSFREGQQSSIIDAYYEEQRLWRIAAWREGCSYVPSVISGFNDRSTQPMGNNPILPRNLLGEGEGSLLAASLEKAQHLLDSELRDLIVINSFNNYQQDTQIYPVYGNPASLPESLTEGLVYEAYGETYFSLLTEQFGSFDGTEAPTATPSLSPTKSPQQSESPDSVEEESPPDLNWCGNDDVLDHWP